MNKTNYAYNIFSKLNFEKLPVGKVNVNPYKDDNPYSPFSWTFADTTLSELEVKESNGVKIVNLKTNNSKLFNTDNILAQINSDFKKSSFQLEINISIPTFKTNNIFFNIASTGNIGFRFDIKRTRLEIICNGKTIICNHSFNENITYNIVIGKIGATYFFIIDGMMVGKITSDDFNNNLNHGLQSLTIGASNSGYTSNLQEFNGNISNINIAYGNFIKYTNAFTKYGEHLMSRYNFANYNINSTIIYYCDVESVLEPKLNWSLDKPIDNTLDGYYKVTDNKFSASFPNNFTMLFGLKNKVIVDDITLVDFGDYKIKYTFIRIGIPEPDVIVDGNTISALNFENDIVDKVSTTTWNAVGNITTNNVIFGDASYETKVIGDCLELSNPININTSNPYSIDFYMLYKGGTKGSSRTDDSISIFSKNDGGDKYLALNDYRNITWTLPHKKYNTKVRSNEITHYTLSFDGSVSRLFINGELDAIGAGSMSFNSSEPLRFGYHYVSGYPQWAFGTNGIWDNINIFKGVATQVRTYDTNEEKIVIDLSLDGENNSTKIVDNAYNNILPYYNKNIVSLLYLKNNVNDEVGNNWITNNVVYGEGVLGCGAIIDGYISCLDQGKNNPAWQMFYDPMGSLDFYIKRGDSSINKTIFSYWTSDIRWKVSISNTILTLDVYIGTQQTITFNIPERTDMFELFTLVRHNNGQWELFVNGLSCGKSGVYNGIVYAGIGSSIIIDTNNGLHQLSMFRFIKDLDIYNSNFSLPTEPYKYIATNNWLVNGSAKLSNTQKFDGISSLNLVNNTLGNDYIILNKEIDLNNTDFTLSFNFYLNAFVNEYSSVLVASKLSNGVSGACVVIAGQADNRILAITLNDINGGTTNTIRSAQSILLSKEYKIDIIVKNGLCNLYINNILESSKQMDSSTITLTLGGGLIIGRGGTLSNSTPPVSVWNSSMNGFIKNFKLYKGVAIEPISPIGKIQLDFDNDLIDKYNNSTWSNNGITFNIENSVKGYCIYNQSTQNVRTYANSNLNFENKSFIINMDTKILSRQSASVLMMSGSANDYQEFSFGRPDNGYSLWCNNTSISVNNSVGANLGIYVNNTYYNNKVIRKNNTVHLLLNDVIVASRPLSNTTLYDFNNGISTTIGSSYNSLSQFTFNGYIDNFSSTKDYKGEIKVNTPVLYLPLETNSNNIGYASLTINNVGSPTFTIIDNKKCIKFESGKYLTINSNNIFKLGTSSDFYIEMDVNLISFLTYNMLITNNNSWTNGSQSIWITDQGYICIQDFNGTFYKSTNAINLNSWYKIKIYRKDSLLTIEIDDKKDVFASFDFNLSINLCYIGCSGWAISSDRLNGYMCNLTMIVGTYIKDVNYNEHKVLDVDFKPTNKSYLFKDNNSKCILHPVNITSRDYIDSKYCCTFNGINQYILLGNNNLLNFEQDSFIINVKFKLNNTINDNSFSSIMRGFWSSTGHSAYFGVGHNLHPTAPNKFVFDVSNSNSAVLMICPEELELNKVYDITIMYNNNVVMIYIDGVLSIQKNISGINFNFNSNGNTVIGAGHGSNGVGENNGWFNGTIYSLKALRNTNDLSLLDDDAIVNEMHETFTLTNGNVDDDKIVNFDKSLSHDIQLVSDNQNLKMIIDNVEYDVPKSTNIANAVLFDGYKGDVKDLRVYDVPFSDKDVFMGSQVINTEYPELMVYDDDYTMDLNVLDIGDYVLRGFIEGYTDRKYRIYNKSQNYIVQEGIEDYEYNGINFYYFDEYEIHDLVNGQRYPLYTHEMIKGYIGGSVNLKNCGVKFVDMKVYCYRNDNSRLIGVYNLNEDGTYTIPNLDVNSFYDIVFKDQNRKIENISSSYRKPKAY